MSALEECVVSGGDCARCGRYCQYFRSTTAENNEMDVCAPCEFAVAKQCLAGKQAETDRLSRELAAANAKIARVEALADECAEQQGQCWNSLFARRVRAALAEPEVAP